MFLRLWSKLYYSNTTNCTWTLDIFQFKNKCKYFLPYYRYKSNEVDKNYEMNLIRNHQPVYKIVHSKLRNSIYYQDSTFPRIKANAIVTIEDVNELYNTNWLNEPEKNVLNAIKKLTYCHLSGSEFEISLYDCILKASISKLSTFSDQQIMMLLQCLVTLSDITNQIQNRKLFLKALNKECLKRFFPRKVNDLLLICDAFYQLQDKTSDYTWRAIRKLGSKSNNLSGKQLVQLLLYSSLVDSWSCLNMFEIELRIRECMSELTGNELGIITRGFFLNKRSIKNKALIPEIIQRADETLKTMDSIFIGSVMKVIRYSDCVHCIAEFQTLLKSLHTEIPRLQLKCLTHIAHAFGALRVYDATLTDLIVQRIQDELNFARLKDIERIIYTICTITPLCYTDVCHKVLNEIMSTYKTTRSSEINKYPLSFIRILTFLTIKNLYVPEFIEFAFDDTFIRKSYKNNLKLLSNEYLSLHGSVKIDLPHYKGPLLNKHLYEYLTKKFSLDDEIHKAGNTIKLPTEIVFICKNKLGIDVHVDYILPHAPSRDIIFATDEYDNFIGSEKIESIFSSMSENSIKYVNTDELKKMKWKVIYILPSRVKVIGHDGYIGPVYRKLRQFKAVGYTPIPIFECKWNSYSTDEMKENYLKQVIYQETDNELKNFS